MIEWSREVTLNHLHHDGRAQIGPLPFNYDHKELQRIVAKARRDAKGIGMVFQTWIEAVHPLYGLIIVQRHQQRDLDFMKKLTHITVVMVGGFSPDE